MAGSRALRKIQLGKETTAGIAVAATTLWRGMGTVKDNREVVFPEEDGPAITTNRFPERNRLATAAAIAEILFPCSASATRDATSIGA